MEITYHSFLAVLNIVQPTLLTNSGATLPFQQMIPISQTWANTGVMHTFLPALGLGPVQTKTCLGLKTSLLHSPHTFPVPLAKPCHLSSIATSSIGGQLGNPSYGPPLHVHNAVGTQSRGGPCPKEPTLQPQPGSKRLAGRAGCPEQQLAQQA